MTARHGEAALHANARISPRTVEQSGRHFVMFYEKDGFLIDEVFHFLAAGLRAGDTGVVIASREHREALEARLLDAQRTAARPLPGQAILLDARETLARFMQDGMPDRRRFTEAVGGTVRHATALAPSGQVRAFGEMVALLTEDGNPAAALELEQLWNELAEEHEFSLFCAYPMHAFARAEDGASFRHVCAAHTHVRPGDGAHGPDDPAFDREIAVLRQKARALETEIERRTQLERDLQHRLAELAECDRRKDEFLAMLGHELRNPLAPITTSLRLMRMQSADAHAVARAHDVIERQVGLLTRLVNDLVDVARIAHGTLRIARQPAALDSVFELALDLSRPLLERCGHRLEVDCAAAGIRLECDVVRLAQVVASLLDNAARYTCPGGAIRLAAHAEDNLLRLTVSDNGSGMEQALRERVFEPFAQGANPMTPGRSGLGVGLTLARAIVELHGGRIAAASGGAGCGSEFTVELPLARIGDAVQAMPQ